MEQVIADLSKLYDPILAIGFGGAGALYLAHLMIRPSNDIDTDPSPLESTVETVSESTRVGQGISVSTHLKYAGRSLLAVAVFEYSVMGTLAAINVI